ncbi:HIPL1 protein-like [Andrographis paniculata]|uniref:HIPL1 protein-like n=1 Tax=Andrographis paniculata TaxID=175694 RepID=UPI0021E80CE9|nr:HIPL1 protein-like [Andrographis paniculata]
MGKHTNNNHIISPCFHPLLLLLLLSLACFISPSSPFPLCTDLRQPSSLKVPLAFCPYKEGRACCTPDHDLQLRRRFLSMNISASASACADAVKSILCATCDPFSAQLFDADSDPRPVPILCNSTGSSFCAAVWKSCQNVPIQNSPFAPALQSKAAIPRNATSSTLADLWQSDSDFCAAFGGSSAAVCFDGKPVVLSNNTGVLPPPPPEGICFEKLDNGSYINMAPHPDGSNRAFLSTLSGKIYLVKIPDQDSGEVLDLDESSPFVDLTDQVFLGPSYGMMGMAFHPDFAANGRFFASFNCDKEKSPGCGGRCACNSDVGCDPAEMGTAEVCKYHAVVAEYSANATGTTTGNANPNEVRRIFTLGLPYGGNHGGQILFGPADKYMYIMMGDGGGKGDPYNFAQNKKSLLGKVLRVDVDNLPSDEEVVKLGRWGNYSVPRDNPYSDDKEMEPEIWAYGLRNPWRCSFDAKRPVYFLCADTGQDQYEEVDIITKGGNYGWRMYEGPIPFKANQTPGGDTLPNTTDPIFPVASYSHSQINKLGSAAISGGFFYRAQTDPCVYGSYLYGDLYGQHIWAASEAPEGSGKFTANDTPFSCARDSPIKCDSSTPSGDNGQLAVQLIFSFGQDNNKDVYLLTQSGLYRVVRPSRCNYACSKEVVSPRNTTAVPPSAAPASILRPSPALLLLFVFAAVVRSML